MSFDAGCVSLLDSEYGNSRLFLLPIYVFDADDLLWGSAGYDFEDQAGDTQKLAGHNSGLLRIQQARLDVLTDRHVDGVVVPDAELSCRIPPGDLVEVDFDITCYELTLHLVVESGNATQILYAGGNGLRKGTGRKPADDPYSKRNKRGEH